MMKIKNWVMAGGVIAMLALAIAAGSALSTYPANTDGQNLMTEPNLLASDTTPDMATETRTDWVDPSS